MNKPVTIQNLSYVKNLNIIIEVRYFLIFKRKEIDFNKTEKR